MSTLSRAEQGQLLAERMFLQKTIADIPAEDVLDRASFKARLSVVEQHLAAAEAHTGATARARLAVGNVHEETRSFSGAFQGVLPKRRTFEFRVTGEGAVITGKIGSGIPNPDALNHHLHVPTQIALVATRLGNGRPRYVLNQEPDWSNVQAAAAP